jgi:MFS family permease
VFLAWWRSGQSLDVENIATFRGAMLYWIAILVSNSLGTSSGDFLADRLGFGFLPSVILVSAALLALLALHYWTRVDGRLLFWIAFVLTRPVGLMAAAILVGCGVGIVTPIGFAYLAASTPSARLGQTLSAAEVGREIGDAGGPLLVGALAAALTLTPALLVLAALLAMTALVVATPTRGDK